MSEEAVESAESINLEEAVEAILFAAGHPVTYAQLASTLAMSIDDVRGFIELYEKSYNNPVGLSRGVMLLLYDDSCQLCTKPKYLSLIRDALGIRRSGSLSNSAIETLAIIAYNQPVTRSYVDKVRGVDSSYALSSLAEWGLIESKGRLEAAGRPMLYGTTTDFLRCFGLSSLSDLPGIFDDNSEAAELFARADQQMSMQLDESQSNADNAAATDVAETDAAATDVAETGVAEAEAEPTA